jgi:hypothetical protein
VSWRRVVASGLGLLTIASGCSLLTDLSGYSGGAEQDASTESDGGPDAATDSATVIDSGAGIDSGADASSCACPGLVSAYRFSDPNSLGRDFLGKNNMSTVHGNPKQSRITPPGLAGDSIQLDGSSAVCIESGFTFDSTADHTLCWWSQPAALADSTNQFAQACAYDSWTTSSGVDYLWRINNCNTGTPANLQVPGVYSVGKWVQICQTYTRASMTRAVVIDGRTSQKVSVTDTVPIVSSPSSNWCIGSYGDGGFWTGLIYLPMWFKRVLADKEIEQLSATACCLP